MRAHSGGRNSESFSLCVQQPAATPTDNFALFHCTFQQGSAASPPPPPPALDGSTSKSIFNLQHRPNSTLLHYYNQQQHCLASRHSLPPPPRINVARAIRFSSTTRSCNTPPLTSPSRYSTSRQHDGIATWRHSTA